VRSISFNKILLIAVVGIAVLSDPVIGDMWVAESGDVGIGTSSPEASLHIRQSIDPRQGCVLLRITNSDSSLWQKGDAACGIEFQRGGPINAYIKTIHTRPGGEHPESDAGLVIGTSADASNVTAIDRMLISSDGNVGIGTLQPEHKLSVAGAIGTPDLKHPFMVLNSLGSGSETDEQSAQISLGEAGRGASSLHFSYTGDGYGYIGMGDLGPDNIPDFFAIRLYYQTDTVYFPGKIGIGITEPEAALDVKGNILAQAMTVAGTITADDLKLPDVFSGPDYVFEDEYSLRPLDDLEKYIKRNKHLPGIPSSREMAQNGVELKQLLNKHLQKIEELTLYLIDLKRENDDLKQRLSVLERRLRSIPKS